MNLDKFRREFHTKVLSRSKELQPLTSIWGTNSPLIQHTLNLAVSCLKGTDEAYLEVGLLYGSSLDSASRGNEEVYKFACDIQVQGEVGRLINDIPNLKFHEGDYFNLDLKKFLEGRKVGVYYYDSNHDYQPTYDALEKIVPYLADKALILMDDGEYSRVYNSWRDFMKKHSDTFTIVHEFWTPDQFIGLTRGFNEFDWHDAFFVSEYEKEFERHDEKIEEISVAVYHGMGEHKTRHGNIWPREFKHIHGKEEIHIGEYNKNDGGYTIKLQE